MRQGKQPASSSDDAGEEWALAIRMEQAVRQDEALALAISKEEERCAQDQRHQEEVAGLLSKIECGRMPFLFTMKHCTHRKSADEPSAPGRELACTPACKPRAWQRCLHTKLLGGPH